MTNETKREMPMATAMIRAILNRNGGREAISSVQREMRQRGWKIRGNRVGFENLMEEMGFDVEFLLVGGATVNRNEYAGGIVRSVFVKLPAEEVQA